MKKKNLMICLAVLFVAGMIILLSAKFFPDVFYQGEEVIHIAVAGPVSGHDRAGGEAMLRGIRLYLDKTDRDEKFDRKIKLLIFNDKSSRSGALNAASSIADGDRALLVLGHYSSLASFAAGEIYKKNGIPAITASASDERIALSNEWYFRINPTNRFQASFAATYINEVLKKKSASIVTEKGAYGLMFAKTFEKAARNLGMKIKRKWEFDPENKNLHEELKKIVNEIRATDDPGVFFLATHADGDAMKIITSIKYPGTDYTIIGPDNFSDPSFLRELDKYPSERRLPGYYSDGIYALSPFIADVAGEKGRIFRKEFLEKYDEEPSWVAACYYDAMHVAVTAIEHAEIYGENIRKNRRKLRDTLAEFDSPELALRGVSGDIFFDTYGNALRPLMVGIYESHRFLPTFSQYQGIFDPSSTAMFQNTDQETEGVSEKQNGQIMTKTRVVYAGIDINEILNPDVVNRTYTADFYVWFRFQGEFDDTRIRFVNAVSPVRLGRPITEISKENITIRTYRVRADFKGDFDLYTYLFDHQILRISLRHPDMTRAELIYVPDTRNMYQARKKKDIRKTMIREITGWHINEISFYQNTAEVSAPDSKKTAYSQFNAAVRIKRKEPGLILKHLFLPVTIMILLYFVYFMPSRQIGIRLIFMAGLIIAEIYRLLTLSDLTPGHIAIEYAFFTAYILGGISAFISILIYIMHRRGADKKIKFLTRAGKIIHPSVILIAGILIAHSIAVHNSLGSEW
ncbi:ABC transporter substrate-binding protein [Desulfobacterales bacterium HSG2]|nr:ABC transporter substrate-binding protein [Desulfobacterales bacterium HSG2]